MHDGQKTQNPNACTKDSLMYVNGLNAFPIPENSCGEEAITEEGIVYPLRKHIASAVVKNKIMQSFWSSTNGTRNVSMIFDAPFMMSGDAMTARNPAIMRYFLKSATFKIVMTMRARQIADAKK